MKRYIFFLLTLASILTAVAFRIATAPPPTTATVLQENLRLKKLFSIRCATLYIPSDEESIPPLTGWGNYSWKISTTSDSAQFYFNQGINMYYAFHIIEARASFDKARRFDSGCAMLWWGKALAFGPNINDYGYQRPSESYALTQAAMRLTSQSTPVEKALIGAMSIRYSPDSAADQGALNTLYKEAMKKVYLAFPGQPDVGALYADALLLLHPWDLYEHDFTPKQWTPEIVKLLKQTIQISPNHPGANHYFIHTVEASANPGDALKSAQLLSAAMPSVAHMTHMPSHIYIRTGYYDKGITQNENALQGYHQYLAAFPATAGNLPLYSLHNLHMKMNCAQMAGNYRISIQAAKETQAQMPAEFINFGGALGDYAQYIYQSPLFTYIRFGKWDQILQEPVVDGLSYTSLLQHFGRGLAFARTGQLNKAQEELANLEKGLNEPSLKIVLAPFNKAYDGATIARNLLAGSIAVLKGFDAEAIKNFQIAVETEDNLIYNEPRDWLLPARQYLGEALLKLKRYKEAVVIFQEDLKINPNNGWSLTGLTLAYSGLSQKKLQLLAQKRTGAAWLIKDLTIKRPVF